MMMDDEKWEQLSIRLGNVEKSLEDLMTNHIPHINKSIEGINANIMWLKLLTVGIMLSIIGGAFAVILTR